ncbi:MAG TPA: circadian clock protein KaiC, partial [Acidimicrobiales bacterium]|nr:circadian clock protein KaiC [Acidimicrobiales bacterium]
RSRCDSKVPVVDLDDAAAGLGSHPTVRHSPTGVLGLDDVTCGGLPEGRATLVAGGPGCGKTLLATEFLVRGAELGEPGVFVAFEESHAEIVANAASVGFDLQHLMDRGLLLIDHVELQRNQIEQTGDYTLDGLFVRLGLAVDRIGAKRVVIDTIEVLFATLGDTALLRSEMRRLFRWLKDRNLTAVVTAERAEDGLTRHAMEEYVSDCVILLDHRVTDQLATRRLRIVKFRGSPHSSSELPFLIGEGGFSVVPVSRFDLQHPASPETVSSGVPALDAMLGRHGWYRGSTVMVSGTSGTGKSTFAAHFAAAACERGERCLYMAFEEGPDQIIRNMASAGIELRRFVEAGRLVIRAGRPTQAGLENHLTSLHREVEASEPSVVVIDPITDFHALGTPVDIKAMLMRMIDFLKQRQITALLTSLMSAGSAEDVTVSSLIDSWVQLRHVQSGSSRRRALYVLKVRGMAHSQDVCAYDITDSGIRIGGPIEDEGGLAS